jgi:hypothetical protein
MSIRELISRHHEAIEKYGASTVILGYGHIAIFASLVLLSSASLSRNNILEEALDRTRAPISKEDAVLAGYAVWAQQGEELEFRWRSDMAGQGIKLAETSRALESANAYKLAQERLIDALRDRISVQGDELKELRDSLRKSEIIIEDKVKEILDLRRDLAVPAPVDEDDEMLYPTLPDVKSSDDPAQGEDDKKNSSWIRRLFG